MKNVRPKDDKERSPADRVVVSFRLSQGEFRALQERAMLAGERPSLLVRYYVLQALNDPAAPPDQAPQQALPLPGALGQIWRDLALLWNAFLTTTRVRLTRASDSLRHHLRRNS